MEEIDLKELYEFFKGKIGSLLIIIVVVCLLGSAYSIFIQKPMYKSYTTVVLAGNETTTTNNLGITQSDVTLNKNLVDTYAEIVKSRRVLDQVIKKLKLNLSYEALNSKISVTALNNTEIIKISVVNEDPILAKNIANVTANYFIEAVIDLFNMNNVNVLDVATEAANPYNINIPKQVVIYLVIGFAIGAGILFIIFYFDRSIKSADQVEQKIKLPILGSVQDMNKGGKKNER